MAVLHEKLYLMSDSLFARRLQYPFASVGEIETPDVESLKEIVSCTKTSCLYIYDNGADCVWKISIPVHRVSLWLDKVKVANSLSVTSNAELGLLMLRNGKPVCLEVYNEHAILLRRLKLPTTIPSLKRFGETPSGRYIGLGDQCVYFGRNGLVISQFEPPSNSKYRCNPQCVNLLPYHVFLQCCTYFRSRPNPTCCSISSLTLDLASSQILVDKSDGWIRLVDSCYLKESKLLLVLEVIASRNDKTWNLKPDDVLPG